MTAAITEVKRYVAEVDGSEWTTLEEAQLHAARVEAVVGWVEEKEWCVACRVEAVRYAAAMLSDADRLIRLLSHDPRPKPPTRDQWLRKTVDCLGPPTATPRIIALLKDGHINTVGQLCTQTRSQLYGLRLHKKAVDLLVEALDKLGFELHSEEADGG